MAHAKNVSHIYGSFSFLLEVPEQHVKLGDTRAALALPAECPREVVSTCTHLPTRDDFLLTDLPSLCLARAFVVLTARSQLIATRGDDVLLGSSNNALD